jgi:hypothetical protein
MYTNLMNIKNNRIVKSKRDVFVSIYILIISGMIQDLQ